MFELTLAELFETSPRKIQKPIKVLGIDLGTTNSAMAEIIFQAGQARLPKARCLEVEQFTTDGEYINYQVPSVVALYNNREIIGEGAKRLRAKASELSLGQNANLFYDCKNDIGIRKTYHKAPKGYRNAAEIAGRVLGFLKQAALRDDPSLPERMVVTVPASFQAAQRSDTLKAAQLAGIDILGGHLLDEPVAAFIDYLSRHSNFIDIVPGQMRRLLVFDFGGGTCDVAVFSLTMGGQSRVLNIASLAVSRYHRLGGGDIDAAILHEELIPQMMEQNGLSPHSLGFNDKKKVIEPSFIGLAEALKVGLCKEVARLEKFGRYLDADKTAIVKTQPGIYWCQMPDGQRLSLQTPKLSAARFEELLEPFLDTTLLYARETEYRLTRSIFAPIQDAMDRCCLSAEDIDYCLLVGGSCLIPQVEQAIGQFFNPEKLLTYADQDSIQTAVARGAAFHALSLALYGRAILPSICHDSIAIMTSNGPAQLIPKGAELPFPKSGEYARFDGLTVPETALLDPVQLLVDIVGGEERRSLMRRIWAIPAPINQGVKLSLEYRLDENQCLHLNMRLAEDPQMVPFSATVENPLTNVVNPQTNRVKIDEIEESLRSDKIPVKVRLEKFVELANCYAELHQYEKAIEYLSAVLRQKNEPDAFILNKIAIFCEKNGDHQKAEKLYREAAKASSWSGPWFNLALSQTRRKLVLDALESVNEAIRGEDDPAYLVLRAQIQNSLGNLDASNQDLKDALDGFGPIETMDDWQLGWLTTAAEMAGDTGVQKKAQAEQHRRSKGEQAANAWDDGGGKLPDMEQSIQRRD